MREVVFREIDRDIAFAEFGELIAEHAPHKNLFLDPGEHGGEKADETAGRKRVVGLEEALEFQKGLFVKGDGRKVFEVEAGLLQNVAAGIDRKGGVVLFPSEALFLGSSDNLAVDEERGGAVVIERGNAKDRFFHSKTFGFITFTRKGLEQRVDERRDGRTGGEKHDDAEAQQNNDHGQQPEFLALLQKAPKILQEIHASLLRLIRLLDILRDKQMISDQHGRFPAGLELTQLQ